MKKITGIGILILAFGLTSCYNEKNNMETKELNKITIEKNNNTKIGIEDEKLIDEIVKPLLEVK